MNELVSLQKDLHALIAKVTKIEERVQKVEEKQEKHISLIKTEAKEVLEKAAALVNPYSPNTMTHDK